MSLSSKRNPFALPENYEIKSKRLKEIMGLRVCDTLIPLLDEILLKLEELEKYDHKEL